ncbi:unnamed protein product [Echinostoma caproni]|uniref:BHLH domain-containing protein n=1 Tax=Echinostoma caproni TaxID=27848 RepID=A0A183B8R4_9TREM|nr:unnamed protein product [Echinostoma caproni]
MNSPHVNPMFHVTNPMYTYRVPPLHSNPPAPYHMESNSIRLRSMPLQQQQQPQPPPTETCAVTVNTPIHRRGRKSTVPPEQREQIRRLKKQNMERRRRACISDKMNALHSMAMSVVGIDAAVQQKVEKADILGICYTVLEGIAKLANERPELRSQLHGLRSYLQEHHAQTTTVRSVDEHSQSSACSEEVEHLLGVDSPLIVDTAYEDKENRPVKSPSNVGKTSASQFDPHPTSSKWHSTPSNQWAASATCQDSGYSSSIGPGSSTSAVKLARVRSPSVMQEWPKSIELLSASESPIRLGKRSAFRVIKRDGEREGAAAASTVWRPYLDD